MHKVTQKLPDNLNNLKIKLQDNLNSVVAPLKGYVQSAVKAILKLTSQDCTDCRPETVAPDLAESPFPCPRVLALCHTAGMLFCYGVSKAGE